MRIDVMYTLSELLRFCHSSEIQFLNAVESCVRDALQSPNEVVSEASFKNLRYFKDLLDTHVDYLQGTLSFIKEPKDARWPSAKYDADIDVVGQVLSSLLDDYTYTLERAEMMVKRIVKGIEIHANEMMLTESKKAILQAESTTRLTLLAAFFLLINLVTSFFSMNFKQFGQGSLHIWIAFACMGTMLLASSVALVMSKPEILLKPIRRMYRWYRDRKLYGF
jgi:Mg2+ and Co2+ transporter CorA